MRWRNGENYSCTGTEGKEGDIILAVKYKFEAQLVELMPSCNYVGTYYLPCLA